MITPMRKHGRKARLRQDHARRFADAIVEWAMYQQRVSFERELELTQIRVAQSFGISLAACQPIALYEQYYDEGTDTIHTRRIG